VRIHKKYDLGELARRIQAARTSAPGSPLKFKSFDIHNIESVLETCVDFPATIPEPDRESLVRQGVARAAESAQIDAAILEQCLREAEREYLRQPLQTYVIASSLTLSYFETLRDIKINGVSLRFSRTLPARFERQAIREELNREITIEQPDQLTTLRTRVRARTEAGAVNLAIDTADFLRGLWNFWVNYRTNLRIQFGSPQPINQILWGPVHTLHTPEGALASETFWAEPKHQQSEKTYSASSHWAEMRKWEKWARRRIEGLQYADEMRLLVARYSRALDLADYDAAFNKLWAVFEHLAGAIGNYDGLIKRTLFLYTEQLQDFNRLILEHLRDVRNGLVHLDRARRAMDTYIYQLKRFVEVLMQFHLSSGKVFSSISTAGQFLDLPQNTAILEARITELRMALRFRTPKRE
jgi:hypothetical protein